MKLILTPLSWLLFVCTSAQTIQYSDLGPFGVQADMQYLSASGLPTLGDGTGQTWDLSGLALQQVGTMAFSPAAGTAYAANYPTANWVWAQSINGLGDAFHYLGITPNGIELLARNVPTSTVDYSDPAQVMKFPLAFGGSFTDPYTNTNGSDTLVWTYTGHGTLITPMGTFTDVAKLVNNEGEIACWKRNPLYPVMLQDDEDILFFVQNNVGVQEQHPDLLGAWPNPCRDVLNMAHAAPGSSWQVLDTQGRMLLNGAVDRQQQVDVRMLAAGSYLLVSHQGMRLSHVRFVKE